MKDEQDKELLKTVTLPLWKACLEDMIANGIDYRKVYPTEYFEGWLQCQRDTPTFDGAIHEIRKELEWRGRYLCGRGQNGQRYTIVEQATTTSKADAHLKVSYGRLVRGFVLVTKTETDMMTDEEKRQHERVKYKAEVRTLHMARANKTIAKKIHELTP